jgi:quercetin dioxygenase-like cupin family protein
MAYPQSKISLVANTWVKQMRFEKAGDINDGHTHIFDHQTLLAKGKVNVTVNNKVSEFTAPTIIFIRAGFKHEIQALEDDTICYCIHAIRDGEKVEDIVDPKDIPETGMDYCFIKEGSEPIVPTRKQFIE